MAMDLESDAAELAQAAAADDVVEPTQNYFGKVYRASALLRKLRDAKAAPDAQPFWQRLTPVGHGINFWQGVARMVELVQPVCDAIHQLEADRPLLSRVLPIWVHLLNHAKAFDAKYELTCNARTARIFNRRFALHYQK